MDDAVSVVNAGICSHLIVIGGIRRKTRTHLHGIRISAEAYKAAVRRFGAPYFAVGVYAVIILGLIPGDRHGSAADIRYPDICGGSIIHKPDRSRGTAVDPARTVVHKGKDGKQP